MTLGITTPGIMTLGITTLGVMTLGIMTLGIMTLSIMTLGITVKMHYFALQHPAKEHQLKGKPHYG